MKGNTMNNYKQNVTAPSSANTDWQHWEVIKGCHIWCRQSGWDTIWTATNGEKPGATSGGYYNKESLLKLKNLEI